MNKIALTLGVALIAAATATNAQPIHYAMEATDGSDFDVVTANIFTAVDDDITVNFGIDYSTFSVGLPVPGAEFPASIPEAPNTRPGDAATSGHYIAANLASPARIASTALIAKDPDNPSQALTTTGNYEVQVDIWMNYPFRSGTATEFGGLVLGHDQVSPGNLSGGGFMYTGDSGAAADFFLSKGPDVDPLTIPDITQAVSRQPISGPPDSSFDGQYNPAITEAYAIDPQFDSGSFNANDNENDFWAEVFPLRNDVSASFSPIGGQGTNQTGSTGVINPPGDPGFRWVTVRMEVEPDTMGDGSRDAAGIARVYIQGTYLDLVDDDNDPLTPDVQMQLQGPEAFVGTVDNSFDTPDAFRGASAPNGYTPEVVDFNDPIALVYGDLFASRDNTLLGFGVFDNLIVTPETTSLSDGDFNADGRVDNGDLNLLLGNWGASGVPAEWTNGFGGPTVDNGELNALLADWGFGVTAAIPEPSSLLLGFLAATQLLRGRRN